jgi:hypothetical protein
MQLEVERNHERAKVWVMCEVRVHFEWFSGQLRKTTWPFVRGLSRRR